MIAKAKIAHVFPKGSYIIDSGKSTILMPTTLWIEMPRARVFSSSYGIAIESHFSEHTITRINFNQGLIGCSSYHKYFD